MSLLHKTSRTVCTVVPQPKEAFSNSLYSAVQTSKWFNWLIQNWEKQQIITWEAGTSELLIKITEIPSWSSKLLPIHFLSFWSVTCHMSVRVHGMKSLQKWSNDSQNEVQGPPEDLQLVSEFSKCRNHKKEETQYLIYYYSVIHNF